MIEEIRRARALPAGQRIRLYNEIQEALGELVSDIAPDPACSPRLLPIESVEGNTYNPNTVASPELSLLEQSIRADGITMPVVVIPRGDDSAEVIDGFHRRRVASEIGRKYLVCSVLDRPICDRMASTVRHNRARGKHQVELMGSLVREMMALGWDDARIAQSLGMSPEEMLRLRQVAGAAALLASSEYSLSWGKIEDGS